MRSPSTSVVHLGRERFSCRRKSWGNSSPYLGILLLCVVHSLSIFVRGTFRIVYLTVLPSERHLNADPKRVSREINAFLVIILLSSKRSTAVHAAVLYPVYLGTKKKDRNRGIWQETPFTHFCLLQVSLASDACNKGNICTRLLLNLQLNLLLAVGRLSRIVCIHWG